MTDIQAFLNLGGPVLWAIAVLSVVTLAVILWKVWDLFRLGAWGGARAAAAVALWAEGRKADALAAASALKTVRGRAAAASMAASQRAEFNVDALRDEITRRARRELLRVRAGLRLLDLVVTIAPLLGLFGTVLGMIAAFQALQATGARADPAALAGGIWAALLTTAAGMGVAIPASVALSWFDSVSERVAADVEDLTTRILLTRGRA